MREAAVAVAAHVERIDAVQRRVIGVHGDAQLHRINLDVDCARRGDSENEAKHVQPKDGAAAGEGTPRFAARAVAARVRFEGAAQAGRAARRDGSMERPPCAAHTDHFGNVRVNGSYGVDVLVLNRAQFWRGEGGEILEGAGLVAGLPRNVLL